MQGIVYIGIEKWRAGYRREKGKLTTKDLSKSHKKTYYSIWNCSKIQQQHPITISEAKEQNCQYPVRVTFYFV